MKLLIDRISIIPVIVKQTGFRVRVYNPDLSTPCRQLAPASTLIAVNCPSPGSFCDQARSRSCTRDAERFELFKCSNVSLSNKWSESLLSIFSLSAFSSHVSRDLCYLFFLCMLTRLLCCSNPTRRVSALTSRVSSLILTHPGIATRS